MLNAAERLANLAAGTPSPSAPNVAVVQGVGECRLSSFFGELDPDLTLVRSTLEQLGYDMSQEDVSPVLLTYKLWARRSSLMASLGTQL